MTEEIETEKHKGISIDLYKEIFKNGEDYSRTYVEVSKAIVRAGKRYTTRGKMGELEKAKKRSLKAI